MTACNGDNLSVGLSISRGPVPAGDNSNRFSILRQSSCNAVRPQFALRRTERRAGIMTTDTIKDDLPPDVPAMDAPPVNPADWARSKLVINVLLVSTFVVMLNETAMTSPSRALMEAFERHLQRRAVADHGVPPHHGGRHSGHRLPAAAHEHPAGLPPRDVAVLGRHAPCRARAEALDARRRPRRPGLRHGRS